jgi:DeoR/GlpR family transcriptional regulator of sugar metabolism
MNRAERFARHLRILAAVIREPGLHPAELAAVARVSERTLRRDLVALRRHGYTIRYGRGYQLQESLKLDGAAALGSVYDQQVRLLRSQVPTRLAEAVERELEAEAPATLAALMAAVIERRLGLTSHAGSTRASWTPGGNRAGGARGAGAR